MDFLTAIFGTLMAMTPSKYDTESLEDRSIRMHVVSIAIYDAASRAACWGQPADCKLVLSDRRLAAALLIGKAAYETHLAEYVHEGRCAEGPRDARCDPDSHGVARAHGLWQQWRMSIYPQSDWDAMNDATLAATRLSAWHALTLLAGKMHSCPQYPGDPVASAIAGFAGTCISMKAEKVNRQAALVRKIYAQLPADSAE